MKKLFQFLLGCGLVMLASISYGQSLTLTSPNGGEVWEGASTHTISWNYSNVDYIKIEYSLDNGLSWNTISASYASSALTYTWTVPAIASTQAKVRITSTLQYTQDESNGVFTIPPPTLSLIYPNGGEQYKAGSGQYVEWVSTGLANVNLHYSLDNGANWTSIGTFPATNGYANWVVPTSLSNQLLLRASNSENVLLNDVSNAVTSIVAVPTVNPTKYYGGPYDGYDMSSSLPDALTVTAPNGAEVLYPYATYNITWDYQDVNLVNIFYSTNNGQTWASIASNIAASSKTYAWSVSNAPSTNCLIKVVGVDNPLVDISNAVFTISNSFVQVTYPNGGETFGNGTGQYIEWDYTGVATVKLEYSSDDGTTWSSIGTAPATNRYANWVTPTNAANCIIRISDNLVPALNDVSDAALSLNTIPTVNPTKYYGGPYDGYSMHNNRVDSVQVTSPNGAEIWMSASTQNITWNYNNVDYITIEYTINDGATWTNIASNVPSSQLSYSWTVPSTPSNICRVRIKDMYSNLVDISDEAFIIPNGFVQLLYPNGGESFGKGTGQYIEWNSDGLANIQLDYSIDNGVTWNVIGTFPGVNKYANWVCPLTTSNQALVRISDPSGSGIYVDQSNLSFSITGVPTVNPTKYYGGPYDGYSMYNYLDQYVKVIKPNGGEIWGNGTTQQIKWSTLNNDEHLKVEYTTDNEATWTTLLNDVPNTPVTFNWNISATPSATCKVRATTMSGLEFDKSDNFFTIANTNGIVTNAIAGNNFCPGQTLNVNFTKSTTFNAGNQFIVQLSDSVGTFNGSLVNIGSITSTTPAPIAVTMPARYYTSNQYRLRVIGTNPPTIGTDNGTNFTIKALPLVNLGNDITLCAGNSQTLNATNAASTYLWSTGATTATLSVNQAGTYWVAVTNSCGVSRDTVVVNVLSPPVLNLGPDLQICQNAAVTLTADSGATSYQWSTGAITRSIQAVLAGNYVAYATNQCGTASDNINISYLTAPTIELGNDQGLCPGSQVVLNATASNSTYMWSNGTTSPTLTVTQPGTYWVNVTTQCGVISDQISIYNGGFTLNAGADVQLCGGQPVTLQATGANNYAWSTGQTSSAIQVNPTQTTTYTVNATNIYNCTATDQVVVNVNPTPTAPVVSSSGSNTYCANETVTLSVPMDASLTYQWLRNSLTLSGATSNSFAPTSTANYQLRVTNSNNCTATSSANYITVNPVIGSTTMAEGCTDYTWALNGQNYTTSGTYVYSSPCHADTLVLHLTVGETCDDGDACTINDVFQTDCTCAGTFSDADNDGTCDANDLCAGPEAGTACDDGDVCTLNDVIQDNCICAGIFADADNDGTCDANDLCVGPEAGTACDDVDACTVNDVIQGDCSCAGNFADTDNDGNCNVLDDTLDFNQMYSCGNLFIEGFENLLILENTDSTIILIADLPAVKSAKIYCNSEIVNQDSITKQFIIKLNSDFELLWMLNTEDIDGSYHHQISSSLDASGNILTSTFGYGESQSKLMKISTDGELVWQKFFSGELLDGKIDNAGNVVFTTSDAQSTRIVKLDNVGEEIWEYESVALSSQSYSCQGTGVGPSNSSGVIFWDIGILSDNSIVAAGNGFQQIDFAPNEVGGEWDNEIGMTSILIKLNSEGHFVDLITFDQNACAASASCLLVSQDDRIVVSGYNSNEVEFFGQPTNNIDLPASFDEDAFLYFLDAEFNILNGLLFRSSSSSWGGNLMASAFGFSLVINSTSNVFNLMSNQEEYNDKNVNAGPISVVNFDWDASVLGYTNVPVSEYFGSWIGSNYITQNSIFSLGSGICINVDCNCNWFLDADGDGLGDPNYPIENCATTFQNIVSNDFDCDDSNSNGSIFIGAICDDYNECTINDVFQTDCTCVGTFSDADNDGTCDANDLCAGLEAGTACDDGDVCTLNDVIQPDCTCAGIFADADNDGTCDANDLCVGPEAGTACDDGDACTVNDVIQDNCTCAGTFSDADNDGTCDANDLCAGPEAGTACDDGDVCTLNDVIHDNCTCSGLLIDANNDGICDLNNILGCTDENACNYNPEANTNDGSCILPQPEICDGLDNNCDGVVDEGLVPSGLNITNVATMQYPVCVGTAIASANLNNGANSTVIDGDGNDLWFGITAQYNTLRAGLSAANGNNILYLFEVNPAGCLELLETEHENTTGNQTLLTDQLTVGQTYYVAVHNISGPMNASAKICFNHLNASSCDHYYSNNTGIYTSVCNSFKAQYRANAVAYTFDVLSATQNNVDQAIAPWTYTTPNAISVISRLGMILPANQGISPMVYTLKVPVLYSLFDAAGNFENLYAQATSTCTVTLNAESTVALRSSDRCPMNKAITSNIAPDRTVCGAMRYDWEFTEVLPTPGAAQVVQGGAYASVFFLSNVPGVATGKTYNVRVRPVHSSGVAGNWGSVQCLRIGNAGMVLDNHPVQTAQALVRTPLLSLRAGGEMNASYSIYPNPTATGSFVLQYNGTRRGESIFAQETTMESTQELVIMDITGKVVYQQQVVLNGNAVEIKFGDLASGVYVVMVGEERMRLIIE